jgi:hypothetical protein
MSNEVKALYYTISIFVFYAIGLAIYKYYPDAAAILIAIVAFVMIFWIMYTVVYWVGLGGPKR